MINFFVNAGGSFGMEDYLVNRGKELTGRVGIVHYEALTTLTTLPVTGTIFAAIDQAGNAALAAANLIYDQLSASRPAVPVLNHPRQSLQRFALLRRLFEIGCNRFNVIRATDDPSGLRYPVFVRFEHRHNGSLTTLLHDRYALDRALLDLAVQGIAAKHLLVVEFCDTSGPDGLFRKYSAMRIGDTILPRHLHAGPSWVAKAAAGAGHENEHLVREELHYLEKDPHAQWLRNVFNEARIEYGRIDYGLYKGEPQAWEINTNPTLGRGRKRRAVSDGPLARLREPGRAASHRQMVEAFKRLEQPESVPHLAIALPSPISVQLKAEAHVRRRQTATRQIQDALLQNAVSQSLKGAVRSTIAVIAPAVARLVRSR